MHVDIHCFSTWSGPHTTWQKLKVNGTYNKYEAFPYTDAQICAASISPHPNTDERQYKAWKLFNIKQVWN